MWTNGIIEIDGISVECCFKHFEESSVYGIDKGRISKLELKICGEIVANYDRGWDMKATTPIAKQALKQILSKYN